MKQCTACHQEKPDSEFYKNGRYLRSRCKDCLRPVLTQAKKERERRNRLTALIHYSGSPPQCVCCGDANIEFLTFDHINGGGSKHRKEIYTGGGSFVRWLRNNGYPKEYRVLCYNCNTSLGLHGYCPHQL